MRGYGRPRAAAGRWQAQAILPGSCLPLACSWACSETAGSQWSLSWALRRGSSPGFGLALTACPCAVKSPLPPRVTKLHLFANSLRRTVPESECL